MPVVTFDDQRIAVLPGLPGDLTLGRKECLLFEALALAVEVIKLAGQVVGFDDAGRLEQAEGNFRIAEATGGIDAWGQAIGDILRGHPLIELDDFAERPDAGASLGGENLDTMANQASVLAEQGHNIGYRSHRDQI